MKKRFSLLLVLAATFLMFMPVKVYAVPEEKSDCGGKKGILSVLQFMICIWERLSVEH